MAFKAGLDPVTFWNLSPAAVAEYIEAKLERQSDEQRNPWLVSRWQTAAILNLFAKEGRTIKPADLFEFEDEKTTPEHDPEKWAKAEEIWKRWDEKYKKEAE